jgi:hypothetical protein
MWCRYVCLVNLQDIYVATKYISPEHSSSNVDGIEPIYEQLIADVVKFSNIGHVIVQGDFNACTNIKQDFVSYDDSGRSNPEDDHYISDQNLPRNNLDPKRINNNGRHLLNFDIRTRMLWGNVYCSYIYILI